MIIWGFGRRTSGRNLFSLLGGSTDLDGPSGRGHVRRRPLANLFARFQSPDEVADAGGGDAGAPTEHVYNRFSGPWITVVRYRGCAITDAEIAAARDRGVRIEVVDVEGRRSARRESLGSAAGQRLASAAVSRERAPTARGGWWAVWCIGSSPNGDEWSDAVTGETIDLEGRVFVLDGSTRLEADARHRCRCPAGDDHRCRAVWCNARRRRDDAVGRPIVGWTATPEACPVLPCVRRTCRGRRLGAAGLSARRLLGRPYCRTRAGGSPRRSTSAGEPQALLLDGDYVPLHDAGHGFVDQIVP